MFKSNKGYTLIELIIAIIMVITILAVLALFIFGGISVVHFIKKFW